MGITPTNFYNTGLVPQLQPTNMYHSSNYDYRAILPPLPNATAISYGAFRTPAATALYPSNTAYGTNANPALNGPPYISSAAVLEAKAALASNVVSNSNVLESGNNLQQALESIAANVPGSRFNTNTQGIFNTKGNAPVQGKQTAAVQQFSPVTTSSNINTSSPIINNNLSLTGRNAGIASDNASNIAAVNANFNIQYTDSGANAIKILQNTAAQSMFQKMDGFIPLAPSLPASYTTESTANSPSRLFDQITDTFNNIMSGGGHGGGGGGGGGRLDRRHHEEPTETQKKKGLNLLG